MYFENNCPKYAYDNVDTIFCQFFWLIQTYNQVLGTNCKLGKMFKKDGHIKFKLSLTIVNHWLNKFSFDHTLSHLLQVDVWNLTIWESWDLEILLWHLRWGQQLLYQVTLSWSLTKIEQHLFKKKHCQVKCQNLKLL